MSHTRILIVEDDATDRLLERRALLAEFPDAEIVEVADRDGLTSAVGATPFTAAITDYRLRFSDGLEVLARLQRAMPDVPVVMFTNTGSEEVAAAALRAGASDYIIKAHGQYTRMAHAVRRAVAHANVKAREREAAAREHEARRAAEEANRVKDQFLATVSHELRTPLNAIAGWVQILKSKGDDREALGRGLDSLERNTVLLQRIVEDLLDVSRIVSGQLTLRVRPTDVCEVVRNVIAAVHPAAAAKQLHITVDCPEPLAPASADPDRVHQIVWNLLSNGVKFTPRDGRINIALLMKAGQVELVVRDTGRGIDPVFLPRVFDRFSQQDGPTRTHAGMGLGLE
jgi:signal transduction histidine kinase